MAGWSKLTVGAVLRLTAVLETLPAVALILVPSLPIAILTAYLYLTLGAVILYKTAVLHGHGINFVPWGLAAVKAVLLAKFLMIGGVMKIARGYTDLPLVWPTLYKSFVFLVLLVALVTIEEIIVGLWTPACAGEANKYRAKQVFSHAPGPG